MAILAASTTEPSVAIRPRSDLPSAFEPLVRFVPRFQGIVTSVSFFLFVRSFFTASVAVASLLFASQVAIGRTFDVSKFLALQSVDFTRHISSVVWKSRSYRRLMKKLEYEFFVLVLGPGGNALVLVIFWPGWIIASVAIWALWSWMG